MKSYLNVGSLLNCSMRFLKISLVISLYFIATGLLQGAYVIEGKVNLDGDWQHLIFLATIDHLDDYHAASVDHIINVANIEADGSFVLEGDNLPAYSQFYKLYVIKEEHSEFNACLFVGGDDHNYVHLILNNNSKLKIEADDNSFAPFGDYSINGDEDNQSMKHLNQLVYPGYLFYEIKFPSELRFSQDKLNRDLFNYADSCSNPLASLAALINSDMNTYFDLHQNQYEAFLDRLKEAFPHHPYTLNFERKLHYHSGDFTKQKNWPYFIIAALLGICGFMFYQNKKLKKALSKDSTSVHKVVEFTNQEKKILKAIASGKSNKEIASELFVELSTVKSHINKIYSKLEVKSRNEAILKTKHMDL